MLPNMLKEDPKRMWFIHIATPNMLKEDPNCIFEFKYPQEEMYSNSNLN